MKSVNTIVMYNKYKSKHYIFYFDKTSQILCLQEVQGSHLLNYYNKLKTIGKTIKLVHLLINKI